MIAMIGIGFFGGILASFGLYFASKERKESHPDEEKKIKVISDGYNVSVESVEDAMKAREPVIKELLDFVKSNITKSKSI